MAHSVYAFDAYGTLFDVHSAVKKHAKAVGEDAERLSAVWRDKQLEYSWVRGLCGAYRDFWSLTEEALDFAFAAVPGADKTTRSQLLSAYRTLEPFGEVRDVLARLKENGARLAILSNGSPDMLESAVASAKLDGLLDAVLSVDFLRTFKTDPSVYSLVTTEFKCQPGEVSFQSSNRWDIAGARRAGFHPVWINRTQAPDEYRDLAPARTIGNLEALLSKA